MQELRHNYCISDDIAYNNHDLDDGLRARLFSVRDLNVLPEVGKIFSETFSANI